MVTSKEMLQAEKWDIVTLQQVSGNSGRYETYHPYLKLMSEFVRNCAPSAKQYIHETWAYEIDAQHGAFSYAGGTRYDECLTSSLHLSFLLCQILQPDAQTRRQLLRRQRRQHHMVTVHNKYLSLIHICGPAAALQTLQHLLRRGG